ncbi:MAG: calcineurin-like phosphoesterase C-terminal domain-containing protein [Bacteroidales bacterium]|nr:calcineurin-like phosphoesterase C-terminal domain-containing protein [Bacteroidales bacterium]
MKRVIIIVASLCMGGAVAFAGNISGRVICGGHPVTGVPVSDGKDIVLTDSNGRYSIDSDKQDGTVFVITPSGYIARSLDGLRPGFWQPLHLPAGQEEIHDFVLEKQSQKRYSMILLADMHLSNDPARDDIRRFRTEVMPVVRSLAADAAGTVYTANLGDTTHDIYWGEFNFNESDGLRLLQDICYPTPMYTIMGNHDHDPSIVGEDVDRRSGWREVDCWGPGQYSVNIGDDHWIFLDNIFYVNVEGKGKKAPGVKGDRSYKHILTEEQFLWLEKDLSLVDEDSRIYICTHAPVLYSGGKNSLLMPREQADRLNALLSPFSQDVTVFSGHIHRNDILDHPDYPRLHQRSLPATSGIMWTTPVDWPLYSSDGSDAGIWVGEFESGKAPEYRLHTYRYGERYYRFYDLNKVGEAYRDSEGIKKQQELYSDTRLDYGQKKWRNYVMFNYWGWEPGDRVEMYEKGKRLKVENTGYEDPVKNFAYELPRVMNPYKHSRKSSRDITYHMYGTKTSSAKTPVTVRVYAADGTLKHEETFQRPYPFNPSGK